MPKGNYLKTSIGGRRTASLYRSYCNEEVFRCAPLTGYRKLFPLNEMNKKLKSRTGKLVSVIGMKECINTL